VTLLIADNRLKISTWLCHKGDPAADPATNSRNLLAIRLAVLEEQPI